MTVGHPSGVEYDPGHNEVACLPESVPARYPGGHAVIGELHFRLGRHSAAERAWREALRLTTARADREFLRRRLAVCRADSEIEREIL